MSTTPITIPQYKPMGNLREYAQDRWMEIFSVLAPELSTASINSVDEFRSIDCPGRCGSRFRLFKNVESGGGGCCDKCGTMENGFALLGWIFSMREPRDQGVPGEKHRNAYFQHAYTAVAEYLEHAIAKNPDLRSRVERVESEQPYSEAFSLARKQKNLALGQRVWINSSDSDPILVEYYNSLGVKDVSVPQVLRFNATVPYITDNKVQYYPAVVAPITRMDGATLKIVGLHRTYLTHHPDNSLTAAHVKDGEKITPWGDLEGAVIRLYPIEGSEKLVLTTSTETAIAVNAITGLASWSAITAKGLLSAQIPDAIQTVIIAVDYDLAGVNLAVAQLKSEALKALGKTAVIMSPGEFYAPGESSHANGVSWVQAITNSPERASAVWSAHVEVFAPEEEELSVSVIYDDQK